MAWHDGYLTIATTYVQGSFTRNETKGKVLAMKEQVSPSGPVGSNGLRTWLDVVGCGMYLL